jgi:hypothetical protein
VDLWRDMNGSAWVNAFNQELWQANAELAGELAQLGFDEVQYDYIRFPSDGDLRTADFGNEYTEELRRAAITARWPLARSRRGRTARPLPSISSRSSRYSERPGHRADAAGSDAAGGLRVPHDLPVALRVGQHSDGGWTPQRLSRGDCHLHLGDGRTGGSGTKQKMRPWLQDFNYPAADFRSYEAADVRAQIDATRRSVRAAGCSGTPPVSSRSRH